MQCWLKWTVLLVVLGCAGLLRAAEVQVWTSDVVSEETYTGAVKVLKPVTLIGARNGAFSGKIVVESASAIKGVKAVASALTGPGGSIAATNVQIRYGMMAELGLVKSPDMLLDVCPEILPDQGRALVPVWVTVRVPGNTKAGMYAGEVTVQAEGLAAVKVKLQLEVMNWTLPDPQNYRVWADMIQSPDTLALEYKVPLWSEAHWKLIDHSFRLLSPTGSRTLYVPLIEQSNLGNEQSMVRWIQKSDNPCEFDFTVLDRYLDSAEENLGRPKLVVFMIWDVCMLANSAAASLPAWTPDLAKTMRESRKEVLGKGPRVTTYNPVTKETSFAFLPRYEDAASKALWQPLFTALRKRMAQRGLEKTMMLGLVADQWPSKEEVAFWRDVAVDVPWVIQGHAPQSDKLSSGEKGMYGLADIGYVTEVIGVKFNVNPDKGRMYGWRNPALVATYDRAGTRTDTSCQIRELPTLNITGAQRDCGRLAADYWRVIRNKKGDRIGLAFSRYPVNNWRNLDLYEYLLAPGPEHAEATVRLECLREGFQEAEARIFLEDALLDAGKKARLGEALATRCQAALDEHHRAAWLTIWRHAEDLKDTGMQWAGEGTAKAALDLIFTKSGKKFVPWHQSTLRWQPEGLKCASLFAVAWQEREKALFALAGEVAEKLNVK